MIRGVIRGGSPGTAADALVGSFRTDDEPDQGSPTRASFCQRPGQGPGADEGVRPTGIYASIYWGGRLGPERRDALSVLPVLRRDRSA